MKVRIADGSRSGAHGGAQADPRGLMTVKRAAVDVIAAINTRKELEKKCHFIGGAARALKEAAARRRRAHFLAGQLERLVVVDQLLAVGSGRLIQRV